MQSLGVIGDVVYAATNCMPGQRTSWQVDRIDTVVGQSPCSQRSPASTTLIRAVPLARHHRRRLLPDHCTHPPRLSLTLARCFSPRPQRTRMLLRCLVRTGDYPVCFRGELFFPHCRCNRRAVVPFVCECICECRKSSSSGVEKMNAFCRDHPPEPTIAGKRFFVACIGLRCACSSLHWSCNCDYFSINSTVVIWQQNLNSSQHF